MAIGLQNSERKIIFKLDFYKMKTKKGDNEVKVFQGCKDSN